MSTVTKCPGCGTLVGGSPAASLAFDEAASRRMLADLARVVAAYKAHNDRVQAIHTMGANARQVSP